MTVVDHRPETSSDYIPATTRREAMDWSLVLISQGIESTFAPASDETWQLIVAPEQLAAARDSIRIYEAENRAWPLRHALPWPGFAFDWSVLAWMIMLVLIFMVQSQPGSTLKGVGQCDPIAVRYGDWWRLFTATQLHGDLPHLAANASLGFVLLGLAMGRLGSGLALLMATVCGALANLFALLWRNNEVPGLGASGVIMAALGLLTADSVVQQWRQRQPLKLILAGLGGGLMLFILIGVSPSPRTDVAAHFGGFVAGLMAGVPLAVLPVTRIRNAWLNACSSAAFAALIIATWWLALRKW
jgi:membrane associated rhomboid family serine protease